MKIGTKKYARVRVEGLSEKVIVPVSTNKPSIPEAIQLRWQNIADLVAETLGVPSGQITRFTEETLEIFAASSNPENPFKNNDSARLGLGMFCESVVGRRKLLMVNDIRTSDYWKDNPFSGTGMLSYIGVPILWEDGEVFGTFCLLDGKANEFADAFKKFIFLFKNIVEADLQTALLLQDLRHRISAQELMIREAHHRISNHFSLLIGYVQLQVIELEGNPDLCAVLMDVKNRLRSISLIHEKLCTSEDHKLPLLDVYLTQLCSHIIENVTGGSIDLSCHIVPLELRVELTVAIGLIVAELVTNSLKYAFAGIDQPIISLDVRTPGPGVIALEYRDNGVGLPEGFDVMQATSLGMTLIRLQVEQLHGTLQVNGKQGVQVDITLSY